MATGCLDRPEGEDEAINRPHRSALLSAYRIFRAALERDQHGIEAVGAIAHIGAIVFEIASQTADIVVSTTPPGRMRGPSSFTISSARNRRFVACPRSRTARGGSVWKMFYVGFAGAAYVKSAPPQE